MNAPIKYKVSAVSYLNTLPFLYGIKQSGLESQIELTLDTPAMCAAKMQNGQADICLVPVAVLSELNNFQIISDYCIGASSEVKSVLLVSNSPLNEIRKIYLDYQSRTSVMLVQVLAYHHWKIKVEFIPVSDDKKLFATDAGEAALIIGDRALSNRMNFHNVHDLALEWMNFCGLPFVFACWVSKKDVSPDFINQFNNALKMGVENIDRVVKEINESDYPHTNIDEYLSQNIDYKLDDLKREGLNLFLKYLTYYE